ncbi:MAG: hypothetical protein QFC78_07010 [Pseudomonadota bacterium]|nr:hypothetical protein [Pseudomonadota bacterium]
MSNLVVPPIMATSPVTNVEVTSSDCKVSVLQLEITRLADTVLGKPEKYNLVPNAKRHLHLDPGTYVFGIGFINVSAPAKITINVRTPQADPMIPPGPTTLTAPTATSGNYSLLVQV